MRILIISDAWTPQTNGVVRTYEDLNHTLENAGHTVRVIGPADFPFSRPMPGYSEIDLVLFPSKKLARLVDDFAPDTIHIATEGPLGWAARKLCKKRGWKYTSAYHTHFPDYTALRAAKHLPFLFTPVKALCVLWVKKFHAPSSFVLTTTQSVEDTLNDWNFPAPLHRLTRGVKTEIFHPGPKTLFADLPKPIALYVGRVAIEKNIGALLSMQWTGSKVIVGDGPSRKALEAAYPDAHFVGKKKGHDLADHYRSADIFVFPSKTDTFGIVLIEAMACGLPIAGYKVTGPMDLVTKNILGSVDDNLALAAQCALDAPGTPEDRFQHLQENYTWDVAAAQFLDAQNRALIQK
jgi:glycosyltransferase involved in cell wall biosynthesis